jgi:hypothetical protein
VFALLAKFKYYQRNFEPPLLPGILPKEKGEFGPLTMGNEATQSLKWAQRPALFRRDKVNFQIFEIVEGTCQTTVTPG